MKEIYLQFYKYSLNNSLFVSGIFFQIVGKNKLQLLKYYIKHPYKRACNR